MDMDTILKKEKGLTLIELLIALVISALLIAGLYRTFINQQKTYTVQEQVVDMQQNVRAAINRMMTEIRMAGFGNVSMVLPATIGGKTYNDVVNWDTPAAGALTIVSGMGFTTLTGIPSPNQITVNSLTDSQGNLLFDTADKKYVSIGGLESYTITNIAGTTLTLGDLNGNLTYNHPIGTPIFAIRAVIYQVGMVDGKPTLLRDTNDGQTTQDKIQADGIENLQFTYLNSDGNVTANPKDIRIITVSLRARTERQDPDLNEGDGYRRRQLVSNIHLRNMGLVP